MNSGVDVKRWYSTEEVSVEDLGALLERGEVHAPTAIEIQDGVPLYEGTSLRLGEAATSGIDDTDRKLLGEIAGVLEDGPGIVVVKRAVDPDSIERATDVFLTMIESERDSSLGAGDHFAVEGANDRVWNVMEKMAIGFPEVFAQYYANEVFDVVAKAWLGPGYQITSQVNVVNPGGVAQDPHRDYHLGFMSDHEAQQFPAHVHRLSPVLTLQGAVAHDDMPLETGPTTYLPHSQKYGPGYMAWRNEQVRALYQQRHVQLPLECGDAVFFNPAVLHGAGSNLTTDRRRMANLLQISSAFGRAMEAMDRVAMCKAVVPVLQSWVAEGRPGHAVERVIAAVAEGYAFPSNLDTDLRDDGLHPPSQADIIRSALASGQSLDELHGRLDAKADSQRMRS